MPELPEVETVKNDLVPIVTGRVIKRIDFLWPYTLTGDPQEFARKVHGQCITELTRRGKFLVWHLANHMLILVHLRMTGSIHAEEEALPEPPKNTRAIIHLDSGAVLYFIDPRRFGRFQLSDAHSKTLARLGPEPFAEDFTPPVLGERLSHHKAALKKVLLDQSVMVGLGNLYVDEALFQARLSPLRPANSLSRLEILRLYNAIRKVLAAGIAAKGASIATYYRPSGAKGAAHKAFLVARHAGEACPSACGGEIAYTVVGGRGTYYCPHCQK